MGFNNTPMPWSELERTLSGRARTGEHRGVPKDGGDSPAWSTHRSSYEPPPDLAEARTRRTRGIDPPPGGGTPYAELHCRSNFSFLEGASHPEELVEEAARLGLEALAITDRDGFYGVVRQSEAATVVGVPAVYGVDLGLGDHPIPTGPWGSAGSAGSAGPDGSADPAGRPGTNGTGDGRGAAGSSGPAGSWDSAGSAGPAGSSGSFGWAGSAGESAPGRVVVLARGRRGYANLARVVSRGQMAGEKGAPRLTLADLADVGGRGTPGEGGWVILTGGADGSIPATLMAEGPAAARRRLQQLVALFGPDQVRVEIWDHGDPMDAARNEALVEMALRTGVEVVATNDVRYAHPARHRLATALAAVRQRRSLEAHDPWLQGGATAHLRSGAEQARRFARFPGVVEAAATLGRELAFDLRLVAPTLPPFTDADGRPVDEAAFLRQVVEEGATQRYGARPASGTNAAWTQVDRELELIEILGFPGYFLVVWDIVRFCRRRGIYCQGRGSAANSAVCFALGITAVDAVKHGLLFERFLSPERDGPPDIDIDIESTQREDVIQYVYERHGRERAAQVANVICYRGRSAVRDMARALGYAPGQQDAWAKQVDRWGGLHLDPGTPAATGPGASSPAAAGPGSPATGPAAPGSGSVVRGPGGVAATVDIPPAVLELAREVVDAPRHLGIHSGGMVICDRPVVEVCPVEWGRMADRSVLQWDKDDCAAIGLVKFDLLGLGMLSALHLTVDAIRAWSGHHLDIAELPPDDPEVYAMLCRADSIGVFQVESRAQMATLPRLRPRRFYDLVVEVALIRPGPIQGGSVHPYIRRRNGDEEVTYPHPLCERALAKTLGVPLFQEQLMQMAIDVAGFSAAESDQLRQAMGSKRSQRRMEVLHDRFCAGSGALGVPRETAEELWDKLAAFANYGFPESHSVSFAYLVYASSWMKRYQPAAFCVGLLNAQPMGFYSPHSLVRDARRHGVPVRGPDVNASLVDATLEVDCVDVAGPRSYVGAPPELWGVGGPAVRLGLGAVRGVGDDLAHAIADGRWPEGPNGPERPYVDAEDLARRSGASLAALEALATAGALDCFGPDRRQALWTVGAVAQSRSDRLSGIVTGAEAPTLPGMTPAEQASADLWATSISADGHPTRFVRSELVELGVVTAVGLAHVPGPTGPRPGATHPATDADLGPLDALDLDLGPREDIDPVLDLGEGPSAGATRSGRGPDRDRSGVRRVEPAFVAAGPEPGPAAADEAGGWLRHAVVTSASWGWPSASSAVPAGDQWSRADAPRVLVAGVVTHRQRPATAGGTIFVNLEDETGLVNVVVSKGCWSRHRRVASSAPALLVRGRLERAEGVTNVIAERIWALDLQAPAQSRDFR
ncbi:MAG TPA: DNA polymerase III subunit alpha [Iamia sp.]|nr:DNA polymerase III subunit alpha [Iamia sp.]